MRKKEKSKILYHHITMLVDKYNDQHEVLKGFGKKSITIVQISSILMVVVGFLLNNQQQITRGNCIKFLFIIAITAVFGAIVVAIIMNFVKKVEEPNLDFDLAGILEEEDETENEYQVYVIGALSDSIKHTGKLIEKQAILDKFVYGLSLIGNVFLFLTISLLVVGM